MKPLPLLISVPHAGEEIPPEVKDINKLSEKEIIADGDVGAREIYDFPDQVMHYVTTPMARAFIDMNRAPTDIRKDGIVKTHTCWDVPIYKKPLSDELTQTLIDHYHTPYHSQLIEKANKDVVLGVDCHTMADVGPPVGPDKGKKRPLVCLSNGDGTCPQEWIESLQQKFQKSFGDQVTINDPFKGGYITRERSKEMPWVQLELSRTAEFSNAKKKSKVLTALSEWCELLLTL